ncbi:hypothetical protein BC831DRAFT_472954 [Entophlyctis helioformis]|nr:hypothetical protein BC831DRAFT_472954 [Entophlyctis helioformis]
MLWRDPYRQHQPRRDGEHRKNTARNGHTARLHQSMKRDMRRARDGRPPGRNGMSAAVISWPGAGPDVGSSVGGCGSRRSVGGDSMMSGKLAGSSGAGMLCSGELIEYSPSLPTLNGSSGASLVSNVRPTALMKRAITLPCVSSPPWPPLENTPALPLKLSRCRRLGRRLADTLARPLPMLERELMLARMIAAVCCIAFPALSVAPPLSCAPSSSSSSKSSSGSRALPRRFGTTSLSAPS